MKKHSTKILCALLSLVLLLSLLPMTVLADSGTDKLMAYKVYQKFLTELKNRKDTEVNNLTLYGMPMYHPTDFPDVTRNTKFKLDYIGNIHLIDFDGDGLEDLWFDYKIRTSSVNEHDYTGIYTYKDGKFTKLANGWWGSYFMRGADGNVYFARELPQSFEGGTFIKGYINGTLETVATPSTLFINDEIYGIDLPTGYWKYYFDGKEMTYEQYMAEWAKYNAGGTVTIGNDRIDDILEDLKTLISDAELNSGNAFSDVLPTDYFAKPVLWAKAKDITGGIGNGMFGPNNPCTRAQVVTFLWAANGKPEPISTNNPFTDVPNDAWYLKPVLWAVERGITGGTSPTTFAPNSECTRAQIVTFLYAAAGKPYVDTFVSDFSDVSTSDWYISSVLWAKINGITGGTGPDTFSPNNVCTRGQVVTFLYKAFDGASDPPDTVTPPDPVVIVTPAPTPTPAPSVRETLVSEAQSYSAPELPENAVQDIVSFTENKVALQKEAGDDYMYLKSLDDEYLNQYIAMLEANGFTPTTPHTGGDYESWGFVYNNGAGLETIEQLFTDEPCHLYISRSPWSSYSGKAAIHWTEGLNLCDMGLRMNGKSISLVPKGESLEQGLWRLADGRYQTDDGRLTAAQGEAMVIRNGQTLYGESYTSPNRDQNVFFLNEYNGSDFLKVAAPVGKLTKNKVYQEFDMTDKDTYCVTLGAGDNTYSSDLDSLDFSAISIRLMYFDENVCVLYVYAEAPGETIEALLCAKR